MGSNVGKAMSDDGAIVERLTGAEADPLHPDILVLLSSSSSSSPLLTVYAPAAWLSRIPYFATQLAEPWIDSTSPQQQIALECTPGSTPLTYLQCLRLLRSPPSSWPRLLYSVSKALQILPVADHLLFQECWDACMVLLASSPWSIDEEVAIRATLSKLNMKPSPDVKERLDTSHDGVALEELLHKMLSTPSLEASFGAWCQKCLNHSSASFAEAFHRLLWKVMESLSANVVSKGLSRDWYVLVKVLLQYKDAQQIILYVVNSEELLTNLAFSNREKDSWLVFSLVLEKVEKMVVSLSNVQRARLLKWSGHGAMSSFMKVGTPYYSMRLRLAATLPFNHVIRLDVMKSNTDCIPEWIDQVAYRVSQMDEADLKAVCENFEK